jgi:hypothetical protein
MRFAVQLTLMAAVYINTVTENKQKTLFVYERKEKNQCIFSNCVHNKSHSHKFKERIKTEMKKKESEGKIKGKQKFKKIIF